MSAEEPLLDTLDYAVLSVVLAAVVAYVVYQAVQSGQSKRKPANQSLASLSKSKASTYAGSQQEDDFVGKMQSSGTRTFRSVLSLPSL